MSITASDKKNTGSFALGILFALSLSHCTNDMLQSVIMAVYPLVKSELALSFAQVGLITMVYQISASVFQPVMGMVMDRHQKPWSLPMGMGFTFTGLMLLAFVHQFWLVLVSVALVGIGSSIFHPEAARLTALASGGKRGLAQSLFQVGGNLGGSFGPLLAALVIAPYGRQNVGLIALLALVGMCIMLPVCRWYRARLKEWDERRRQRGEGLRHEMPYSTPKTVFIIGVIIVLIFSKYIYMASLNSYYTFYLIHKFGVSVQDSQFYLFIFLFATAAGTLLGGPIGDRIGRKYVIWGSILGTAPFSLLMPHVGLVPTVILSFLIGFILSSAFPAILVYAQELLPYKIGLISGIFYGFAFGIAGIASAVLGNFADEYGIEYVYQVVAFTPLLGLVACLLPNLKEK
ncbi:MFS transporter [Phocaeicola barnesiae]|uniref:MFS transporter n=1 Tax=Phocaeicola barnesiae TaxID=376804 RepID=UPI0025A34B46|nr:MFS transporter [Phocaeicola barnesiae]MDM8252424.1 MFS transporter [Phocaeicola barnesiae]